MHTVLQLSLNVEIFPSEIAACSVAPTTFPQSCTAMAWTLQRLCRLVLGDHSDTCVTQERQVPRAARWGSPHQSTRSAAFCQLQTHRCKKNKSR